MERGLTKNQIVNTLLKVPHGDLQAFRPVGLEAARSEPDLLGHMIAWNHLHGEVRDSKVALPVLALRGLGRADSDLAENAVAHLCLLGPRELVRAYHFSKELTKMGHNVPAGYRRMLEDGLKRYLKAREANPSWWTKATLRSRKAMKSLYCVAHLKPADFAREILFDHKYPTGSVFHVLKHLRYMGPQEAAGTIALHSIPFPVAIGAVASPKDPDILIALMGQMSGNELVNNTDKLRRLGVFENPVLRIAYEKALEKATTDERMSTLKAARAAEVVGGPAGAKLQDLQDARLAQLGGIEGDWAVFGDRSGSMHASIDLARQVAALIAQQVKGAVHLVFFNDRPTYFDVTGKTLAEIQAMTRRLSAGGRTSIGCGLDLLRERGVAVQGIAICSDGGDNAHPLFHNAYQRYTQALGVESTVYLFRVAGESNVMSLYCNAAGIPVEVFDLAEQVDYYSLPNIVKTLRTGRYTLIDEVMQTGLRTLDSVFQTQETLA